MSEASVKVSKTVSNFDRVVLSKTINCDVRYYTSTIFHFFYGIIN